MTRKRRDDGLAHVVISERKMSKLAKHQVRGVPFPFTSAEQYEATKMGGAIGKEWNVTAAVRDMTRPEVLVRAGKIIRPMTKKSKVKREPAKF
mmetsp:Transcript_18901/g.37609  ORF Transcript_18901/g.37609 Transcript_18901/m.37609 type:complete len:93 (-) Transcript_18901:61-339(-)